MLHYNINLVLGADNSEHYSSTQLAEVFSRISNLIKEGESQGLIKVLNSQGEEITEGIWNFGEVEDECEGAYMIFTCDVRHTQESRKLIGVVVDKDCVLPFIESYVEKQGGALNPDDRYLL